MAQGQYYSIRDLANISGRPGSTIKDIMNFLTRYDFVRQIGTTEPLFTRSSIILSPTLTIKILQSAAKEPEALKMRRRQLN